MSQQTPFVRSEASLPEELERRGASSEFLGRLALTVALISLFYVAWLVYIPGAGEWTGRALRIAPRLSVFALGLFGALALQGCWVANRVLLGGAIAMLVAMLWLQGFASQFEIVKLDPESMGLNLLKTGGWVKADGRVFFHVRPGMLRSGVVLLGARFECAMLAAVFLGTWIGRGVFSAWHFIALLLFGALSDVWINWFHVLDASNSGGLLTLLRLPFAPALGGLAAAPNVLDIVFASAALEGARVFRIHTLSLVLGALAGYCSGSFLGLEPSPAWTHVSMALMACGVLAAAWPDLRLDSNAVGKLFLAVALLILALVSLVTLQHMWNPPIEHHLQEDYRIRQLATGGDVTGAQLAEPLHSGRWMNVPMYCVD